MQDAPGISERLVVAKRLRSCVEPVNGGKKVVQKRVRVGEIRRVRKQEFRRKKEAGTYPYFGSRP